VQGLWVFIDVADNRKTQRRSSPKDAKKQKGKEEAHAKTPRRKGEAHAKKQRGKRRLTQRPTRSKGG